MSIGPPIPEIKHFQTSTLKIQGQGQMTMMLHNYRSRQFHRTLNGVNPSSSFRDMGSIRSGPWASQYGANGQITITVHNYNSRQVHKTLNGLNPSRIFRDMRSAKSGPDLCQIWPMGKPIWVKWSNDSAQLQAWTIPQNFESRKSVKRLDRYGFRKSGSRPPELWQYPSSLEGWGVKRGFD